MAAGFEAKAIVTADMSGFVQASQEAAQAAEALAKALRDVNTQLRSFTDTGRDVARALAPLARASQQATKSADASADAQSRMSAATERAADNINRITQAQDQSNTASQRTEASTRSLARTWVQASENLESLNSALASGVRDQSNLNQSLGTARRVYGQVNAQLEELDDTQRQSVRQQVTELRLRQQVRTAVRDTTQALQLEGRQRELSRSQISNLAREFTRLVGLQRQLADLSDRGAVLGQEDVAALDTFSQRLREISGETNRFSAAQRDVFDATVRTTQATNQAAEAKRRLAEQEREAARATALGAAESAQAETQRVRSLEQLGRSLQQAEVAASRAQQAMRALSAPTAEQGRVFQQANDNLGALRQQLSALPGDQQAIAQSTLDAARAQQQHSQLLRDGATAARESRSAFSQQRESLFTLRSALGDMEGVIGGWNTSLINLGVTIATVFSAQEVAIAQLSRVTQETDVFIDQMTTSLREMSTQIPLAFTELARIGQLGAQVGVANDQLVSFTRTVALFAATTDVSAENASIMFARIAELSDVPEDEISNLGAAVSALGSNSAATEAQILKTTEQIATIGRQAGLSVTTVTGLATAMASLGIRPELARGALQRTLFEIEQGAQGASDKTEGLARVMGLTVDEMVTLREEVGREQFFLQFGEALQRASDDGQDLNTVLRDIGFRNVQDVQVLSALGANWGFVSEQINRANTEYVANNFLQREASRLFDTVTARVQTAINAWQNAAAAIGTFLAPLASAVAGVVQRIGEFVASSRAAQVAFLFFAGSGAVTTSLVLMASALGVLVFSISQLGPVLAVAAAGFARLRTAAIAFAATMRLIAATNPVGLALTLTAAIVAATIAWRRHSAAARESQSAILEANEANFTAAGGVEALQEAVRQDTEAWREHGSSVAFSVRPLERTATAQRDAARQAQATTERVNELSQQVDVLGRSSEETSGTLGTMTASAEGVARVGPVAAGVAEGADEAAQSTGVLERALGGLGVAAQENRFAVGLATLAWSQAAFEAELMSSKLVESQEVFDDVMATGVNLGGALVLEMQNAGDGVEYLRLAADAASGGMSRFERSVGRTLAPISRFSESLVGPAGIVGALSAQRIRQAEASGVLDDATDTLQAVTLQTQLAAAMNRAMTETTIDLGNGTTTTVAQISELGEEGARLEATLNGTTITMGQLQEAFTSLVSPSAIVQELVTEAAEAAEAANENFTRLGKEALPEFNLRMREAQADMVDFGSNLLVVAKQSPEAAAALLAMGDAGVDMASALGEAFETGNIEDFNTAINNINMDAAVASISESFSRILAAAPEARDELITFWDDLQAELAAGDIDLTEFAAQMQAELDRVLGDVDVDISAEIDESELIQNMEKSLRNIEASLTPPVLEPEVDDTSARGRFRGLLDWLRSVLIGDPIPPIEPEIDDTGARSAWQRFKDWLHSVFIGDPIPPLQPTVQTEGMVTDFGVGLNILKGLALNLAPIVIPGLSSGPASTAMTILMGALRALAGGAVTVIPGVNRKPASGAMSGLMGTLRNLAAGAVRIIPFLLTGGPIGAMFSLMSSLRSIASAGVFVPTTVGKGIRRQDGGFVGGPGGPRSDRIHTLLSSGEFVVNAQAARIWAPLLSDINEGAIPNPGIPLGSVPRGPVLPSLTPDLQRGLPRQAGSALSQMMRRAQAAPLPQGPSTVINVNNTYPQAEPTSVTINRSLAFKSVLDGVGPA